MIVLKIWGFFLGGRADEESRTTSNYLIGGIELEFLVEHYIDTAVYRENIKDKIALMGTDEDEIIKGINNYFRKIAEKQIRIAFEQAEKELDDLHQRTREGIERPDWPGKQIGQLQGEKT